MVEVVGRFEASRSPPPGPTGPGANSHPAADSENAEAPKCDDIGCPLTIRLQVVRGRKSRPRPAHRRSAANRGGLPGSSERPCPTSTRIQASAGTFMGWGDPPEGHDCSLGAGDWLRSAPGIGFGRRRRIGFGRRRGRRRRPPSRTRPHPCETKGAHARVRSPPGLASAQRRGLASLGLRRAAGQRLVRAAPETPAPTLDPKPKRTHDHGRSRPGSASGSVVLQSGSELSRSADRRSRPRMSLMQPEGPGSVTRCLLDLQAGDRDAARFPPLGPLLRAAGPPGPVPDSGRRSRDDRRRRTRRTSPSAPSTASAPARPAAGSRTWPAATSSGGYWWSSRHGRPQHAPTRRQSRRKRGGDRVFTRRVRPRDGRLGIEEVGVLDQIIGSEPTPQFAAMVAEEYRSLLAILDDDGLRQVAVPGAMEGYTSDEIAGRLDPAPRRTVARRLDLIREDLGRAGPMILSHGARRRT